MQAAVSDRRRCDVGPVRRLVRVMLQEALTPPFSSNVIDKLSGDFYDLVYGQPFPVAGGADLRDAGAVHV